MEKLYSFKGAYPFPLPKDMSSYDINDFVLAPEKPNLNSGEVLEWVDNSWSIRAPNLSEIELQWHVVRLQRNRLLSESDVYIIRAYESGQPVSQSVTDYRQQLRDITTQLDPFNIVWPTLN